MSNAKTIEFNGKKWIDVQSPSPADMKTLGDAYKLNEHLVRDALEPDHLPKYDAADDVNFLLLRFYSPEADKINSTVQEFTDKIAIFFTADYLITIHKHACFFLDELTNKVGNGTVFNSVEALIIKIAWLVMESYDDPVQYLSGEIEKHETEILLNNSVADRTKHLYSIKRQASVAYKVITLMQEPINHIPATPGNKPAYRDLKDQHLKMLTLYHQCLDDVNNLLNLSMAVSSHKTNEVVKVLTLFSVFFMPLTFIVGIYGMNFKFMPELNQKWGYPAALVLMALVSVIIYAWFKKKRWL